jgi:hypothetical protein
MSISSLGSYVNAATYGASPATSTSAAAPAAAASAGNTSSSPSADWLTLSPDAQAVAGLNSAGITVECVSLADDPSLMNLADLAKGAAPAQTSTTPSSGNGDLSKTAFENALAKYGATSGQADQLFADIDTNGDGAVSNSELLTALGDTGSDTDSSLSQGLLSLMDTSHSGAVSGTEFTNFETSLVTSETSSG